MAGTDIKIALSLDSENPIAGDLYLENGTVRLTNSLREDVAQYLRISMLFFQGEWFLDERQGVPYFQSILGKKTPLPIVRQIFRSIVQGAPGVSRINSFSLTTPSDRAIRIDFNVTLSDGTILKSSDFAPLIVGAQ
jgi:hypothetical protein